ncbi:aldose 1-epimerase [Citrobacter rodentium NBRC 105723 = DSM 16636]|uniref:Aldose 1-epimerase n=1 Tax=Citrobacter rodentium TaxID=67825 RepID=A0A482PW75_CITRO|nr:aldose 1-epimerase [Citrobacter rodentium]UHO33501.1 aldose 1-epimerase [Citrobacter rodentium NBRC 105723 = DSM 16636]HAT8011743.1 aldose 1-epimerase [Citrobacter rodentium NBRC 105723 = DSM 16636]HAT8016555.1 aldose 1-epimerase [Citrobacter rodentium]HAT8026389.1 aldose 1-epimerase [Citrobacter rodentium]
MMAALTLANAHLRMRVDPQGGALLALFSLQHQQPVLRAGEGAEAGECGLFPMLPVANRVAGNRFEQPDGAVCLPLHHADERFFLHGDGWLKRWEAIGVESHGCLLRLRSQHACGFDYLATLHYALDGATLTASLSITHQGERPMLYGCGFHPFFAFDAHCTVQFSASGYWPEGELHLPREWRSAIPAEADFSRGQYGFERWLNVGYSGWGGRAVIRHDVMKVTISAQTPWLMLFRMPGQPFLCLEPQTHPVNAHHMPGQPGLRLLARGETCRFSMQIAVD